MSFFPWKYYTEMGAIFGTVFTVLLISMTNLRRLWMQSSGLGFGGCSLLTAIMVLLSRVLMRRQTPMHRRSYWSSSPLLSTTCVVLHEPMITFFNFVSSSKYNNYVSSPRFSHRKHNRVRNTLAFEIVFLTLDPNVLRSTKRPSTHFAVRDGIITVSLRVCQYSQCFRQSESSFVVK